MIPRVRKRGKKVEIRPREVTCFEYFLSDYYVDTLSGTD